MLRLEQWLARVFCVAGILAALMNSLAAAVASPAGQAVARTNSPLGIGFLWTAQSERVAARLSSDKDFVDVILGPGKMEVFQKVDPPVRVACIALALEKNEGRPFPGVRETIDSLRKEGVAPQRVIIAYNPEANPGTPAGELRNLAESIRKARVMARAYGAPLLAGPGLREMQHQAALYPELAKNCDLWMIQSQRLQLDEQTRQPVPVHVYREKVKRIVDKLRQGNPKIRVLVQVATTAERGKVRLTGEQIASFCRSVEDLVDGVRIYGAKAELLDEIIGKLRGRPKPENP